ncbi:D(2) dopamine receptor A [Schistosoma japonicum]|uniref:D(2) dopamine receptor A n=1 Tax=Schistosoma japonicum TaxID=6182 RepID=A0A4Z2CKP0_SCHJA|nr:D(2) dopamine receptor A [Schistosoma japonicum]
MINNTTYLYISQIFNNVSSCYFVPSNIDWKATNNIITCFLSFATVIIFFGNLLVILSVATRNRLRRVSDHYIASLAVADFLVSVFVLPFAIIRQNVGYWPFESAFLCELYISSDIFMCMSSILNLCCISIDRYIAIGYPLHYITRRTRQISTYMISIAWIIPSLSILPPLFGVDKHVTGVGCCYISYSKEYRIYSSILAYFLPITLIGYVHIRIFCIIGERSKVFKHLKDDSKKQDVWTITSCCLPLFKCVKTSSHIKKTANQFSGQFIKVDKISTNDILLASLNETSGNYRDLADTSSYSYSSMNYFSYKKYNDHTDNRNVSIISSTELEINAPEPVNFKLKVLPIFRVPTSEHELLEQIQLNKSSSSNICFNQSNFNMTTKRYNIQSVDCTQKYQHLGKCRSISSIHSGKSRNEIFYAGSCKRIGKSLYSQENRIFNREIKTVRTVTIVIGCFTVCWTPFFIFYLGEALCDCTFSEELYAIVTWLGYLNSIFNPFIYAFCNKEYANAFKQIVLLKGCR